MPPNQRLTEKTKDAKAATMKNRTVSLSRCARLLSPTGGRLGGTDVLSGIETASIAEGGVPCATTLIMNLKKLSTKTLT
jgi:hypothetical protein